VRSAFMGSDWRGAHRAVDVRGHADPDVATESARTSHSRRSVTPLTVAAVASTHNAEAIIVG